MTEVWAVYTQFYPQYEYSETLKSLWNTREDALAAARALREAELCIYGPMDNVWIERLPVGGSNGAENWDHGFEAVPAKVGAR